jgi:hypothetical protein
MKLASRDLRKIFISISWTILGVCLFLLMTRSDIIAAASILVGILMSIIISVIK